MASLTPTVRFWLFWLCCLPLRAAIAVGGVLLVEVADAFYIFYALYCIVTGIGFSANVALWVAGQHKGRGGLGGRVWWARARILHALLWLAAGVAFFRGPGGWILSPTSARRRRRALHHVWRVSVDPGVEVVFD